MVVVLDAPVEDKENPNRNFEMSSEYRDLLVHLERLTWIFSGIVTVTGALIYRKTEDNPLFYGKGFLTHHTRNARSQLPSSLLFKTGVQGGICGR